MYQFSIILGIGVAIGILWIIRESDNPHEDVNHIGWVIAGSLVGSRAVYVLMNASYYSSHPMETWMVWLGGMNWFGAVLGGLIGLLSLAIIRTTDFWQLLDRFLPAAVWSAAAVWIASWITGTWYGVEMSGFPGMMTIDEWGNLVNRFPLQPIAAIITLAVFLVADANQHLGVFNKSGRFGSFGGGILTVIIFIASVFRADTVYKVSGYYLDTVIAGVLTLIFLLAFLFRRTNDE